MDDIFERDVSDELPRAVLVSLVTRERDEEECEVSLDELERLLDTAGGVSVARVVQNRTVPDVKSYIGSGKLVELAQLCSDTGASLALFDDELTPSQIRNLEDGLESITVLDRTMLILDIFALHARSGEGKLQVELAQLRYTIPRLSGKGNELSRLGGGIGTRGPGETKLETDRRHLRRRIAALEEEIASLEKNRLTQRRARERSGIRKVSIAGYTNAGKSTLLNRLTGAGILAEDKLFATLDPTTRKFTLPCGLDILLTDTVGFIRNLPHHLVSAFRSTLDEVAWADIIVVLVDASDPRCDEQLEVTHKLLWDLRAYDKKIIYVLNKCDCAPEVIPPMPIRETGFACISAKTGEGVDALVSMLEDAVTDDKTVETFVIPSGDGKAAATLYRDAVVSDVSYTDEGSVITAIVDRKTAGKLAQYLVKKEDGNSKDEKRS